MILLAEQTVDWWARGIGVTALAVSALSFAWRIVEWRLADRVKLNVTGTAGSIHQNQQYGQPWFYRGPYEQATHIAVEGINKGREVTVTEFGFQVSDGKRRIMLGPQVGQLPKRLLKGESETVIATPAEETLQLARRGALVPYVKDSEGKVHIGSCDEHFRRCAAGTPPEPRPDPRATN